MKAFQVCSYLLGMAPAVLAHGLHHNHAHAHGQGAEHEFKQGSVILKQESALYPLVQFLRDYVFALGPRYNALVAILIIQFMPCLFVLVVPGLRRTDSASLTLPLLVSFSLGSLLGDVFLHIIPESLIGGGADDGMMVGAAIFLGFICFLALDKTLPGSYPAAPPTTTVACTPTHMAIPSSTSTRTQKRRRASTCLRT